ncbi:MULTISPECIES: hypothetical protein [Flavobacterium]|uniref:Uncharacterized protein n=1 Tax=Flavobacterium hankyongi TaxID=1176532 RepID=A0ABP8ZVQ1_9FLAO|nr:hypothetical protein [Flavobacterium sp. N1846]
MKYKSAKKVNQNKKRYAKMKELYADEFVYEIIKKEKTYTK